ncbi:MAG: Hsp20/alpha crystallin family protein [Alphaproteobacteria bacterium]|nr:Hsp20/alpha crystallin family protein [Alphaproteobacteria bacterium]
MNFRSLLPFGDTRRGGLDDPFQAMQREMSNLFDRQFRDLMPAKFEGPLSPSIDFKETDKAYEVSAELPGVEEKDVELTLSNGILTLKGEKKQEKKEEKEGYHRMERYYGAFSRSFELPADVDVSKVSAEFDKGVLRVTLPKSPEKSAETKKIAIKGGK